MLSKKSDRFHFFEVNIYENLPDLSKFKIDYIFSLASPASPVDFSKIPFEIMRVNSEGTYKLLELARTHNARFLEASTSEVYGDPEVHPQREDYFGRVNPIGPRACYDESKRYAEALTISFYRKYNVDTRIIRIFNTYGPRMRPDDGRVIPNFINQALQNKDVTIYGDGTQTRSFSYVTDTVHAIHNVMHSWDHTPFNCGNPDEYSILSCAKNIVEVLNSKSKLTFAKDLRMEDDPQVRCPDMSKLMSISDYKPQISFAEGIKKTAEYFREQF